MLTSVLVQGDRASEYHSRCYLSHSIPRFLGPEECYVHCLRWNHDRTALLWLDERSLLAETGADGLNLRSDLVRGIGRRFIWISRECDGHVCGSRGVPVSHRHWNWVSGSVQRFWNPPELTIMPTEGSTQQVALRALKAPES